MSAVPNAADAPRAPSSIRNDFLWLCVAGGAILMINVGVRLSLGQFQVPLWRDVGVSSSDFGLIIGINNLVWGVAAIWAAQLAERWGVAPTVALGGALYAVGLGAMAYAGEMTLFGFPAVFGLSIGLVVGLAASACGIPLVLGVIARAAPPEKRTRYLAIVAAGGSFGQFVMPPYAQFGIDMLDWRMGMALLALVTLAIMALALALREKKGPGAAVAPTEPPLPIASALGHRDYRFLNVGFFVCGFHVALIATHMDAYLVTCGLPQGSGAAALAVIGLLNVVGTIVAGVLGDRFRKSDLLSIIYIGRAIVIAAFMFAPKTETVVLIFAAAMGALWLATVPLTSGVVAQKYGAGRVPRLFGFVMLSHQIGAFFGALLGGVVFDLFGGFEAAWWVGVALGVVAAWASRPIDERRPEPVAAPA